MTAVRVHGYHQRPVIEDVPEPRATGPFDGVVKIGGAGVYRADLHVVEGQWGEITEVTLIAKPAGLDGPAEAAVAGSAVHAAQAVPA